MSSSVAAGEQAATSADAPQATGEVPVPRRQRPSKTSSRIALLERESDVATANIKRMEAEVAERDQKIADLMFLVFFNETRIPRVRFTDWVTFTDGFRITYAIGQPVMMFTPLLDKVVDEEHLRVPAFKGQITVMRDIVGKDDVKLRIQREFGKPRPGITSDEEYFKAIADWHDAPLSDSDRVTPGPYWDQPFTSRTTYNDLVPKHMYYVGMRELELDIYQLHLIE
ncbi:g7852 [Coccomyxa viridis]|uniref:G7852 protein n=1 Tax=Coccomyxa viridis TaxID=1274662 RepID=A0ABP1G1C9_9CHLO